MPSALSYPGVYVEEIPSGVRTITGVATSITAFVGRTQRGPADVAVTINSYPDFERIFGGLWNDGPLSFAVRDFYLNGGGQAIIVRIFGTAGQAQAATAADAVIAAASEAAAIAAPPATPASVATAALGSGRPKCCGSGGGQSDLQSSC